MKNILMLMMAGKGTRLGAERPKQFLEIDEIPIFAYILKAYKNTGIISNSIIVAQPEWKEYIEQWLRLLHMEEECIIADGDKERSLSLRNGLVALEGAAKAEDAILIHDATHPYVDGKSLPEIIQAVKEYGAATIAQGEYDTVYRRNENNFLEQVIPRREVVSGASPEAFRYEILQDIYLKSSEEELLAMTSAGAAILHQGIAMKAIESDTLNLKITYPRDMVLLEKLIHNYFFPGIREEINDSGIK